MNRSFAWLRSPIRWIGRLACTIGFWVACILIAAGAIEYSAWQSLQKARAQIQDDQLGQAARELAWCREVWPWNQQAEVQRLQSRIAWRTGQIGEALLILQKLRSQEGATSPDMAYEWALVQAADGNVRDVDEYLQAQADADPTRLREVWEALTIGYLALYRVNDAYTVAQQWLRKFPGDTLALEYRGRAAIMGRGEGLKLGIEDLREVLNHDPGRVRARTQLSLAFLESGRFQEAIPELERLRKDQPEQLDHLVRLARCLMMTARRTEANTLIQEVLTANPNHGLALRTQGQFALGENRLKEAETILRRAAELLPNDYPTQYLYLQVLQQSGHDAEAAEQQKRAESVRVRSTQLIELRTRRLAERPLDPALNTEMGVVLIKSGQGENGVRWLQEALRLDAKYPPAHAALASYYESVGNQELAAFHRRNATSQ